MTRKRKAAVQAEPCPTEPFSTVPCCDLHEVLLLRESALAAAISGTPVHRMASVAGCHPEDAWGLIEGRSSLTPAIRDRLRRWLAERTTEVERAAYVIPASTRLAASSGNGLHDAHVAPGSTPAVSATRGPELHHGARGAPEGHRGARQPEHTRQLGGQQCPTCRALGASYVCPDCATSGGRG